MDTYPLKSMPKILSLDEKRVCDSLALFANFLGEKLKIPPPYRWIAGVEGVKGRSLPATNYGVRGACATDLIELSGILNADDDPTTSLEPFFIKVFEQCGVPRPRLHS
jgi:hypothetical protein